MSSQGREIVVLAAQLDAELDARGEAITKLSDELSRFRSLLLESFRALDYGEPANRHPSCVNRHAAAVELHNRLLVMYRSGELGS